MLAWEQGGGGAEACILSGNSRPRKRRACRWGLPDRGQARAFNECWKSPAGASVSVGAAVDVVAAVPIPQLQQPPRQLPHHRQQGQQALLCSCCMQLALLQAVLRRGLRCCRCLFVPSRLSGCSPRPRLLLLPPAGCCSLCRRCCCCCCCCCHPALPLARSQLLLQWQQGHWQLMSQREHDVIQRQRLLPARVLHRGAVRVLQQQGEAHSG